jgi:hypothetical protein
VRPAAGAWVTYGLGTENQNLPGFVAMCPGGYPIKGTENWRSAFLPGAFQGTYVDTRKQKIDDLVQYVRHPLLDRDTQGRQVDLTTLLDRRHLEARQHDPLLEARLESLEITRQKLLVGTHVIVLRRQNQPATVQLMHLSQRLDRVHHHGLAGDGLVLFGLCGACTAACARAGDQGVKTGRGMNGRHGF